MTGPGAQRRIRISELLATDAAAEKLNAHGISVEEARQLLQNNHMTMRNTGRARRTRRKLRDRRLLIGNTNGGRPLTLVIECTDDSTIWLIVTGWRMPSKSRRISRKS